VSFKILLALMTRNAIIISPHPMAKRVCAAAADVMYHAAVKAGAPDGIIQVVRDPSIPLINALMTDERVDVIVATGGTPVVRSAYRSGNPAIGVGPGNVPVLVDATADIAQAAERIIDSKAFDNSILCTNESVVIAEQAIADKLTAGFTRAGGYLLKPAEVEAIRATVFPGGHFNAALVGKDAAFIAEQAGIRVPALTRVLVAPIDLVVPEEPLAHEKLLPVLAMVTVPTAQRGIDVARAVLRITGAGHSAAVHSNDPALVMAFSAAVPVLRVSVNVGNSLGSSGLQTNLAPSMTIGTGFFGRSSVGENLQPKHLINHTRIAYNADPREAMPAFAGLVPWSAPVGAVPMYPRASNEQQAHVDISAIRTPLETDVAQLREEIRRVIIEELQAMVKG
jgi:acyl-CoA reductase-like NAD-dependent aldehyde dehydrogenase